MIEVIAASFSSGLITGIICGALLFLVFKKDFWRIASMQYRKTFGHIAMLQGQVEKYKAKAERWETMFKSEEWYKDYTKYQEKLLNLQEKSQDAQKQLEKNSTDREEISIMYNGMMEAHESLHKRVSDFNRNIAWVTREFE